VGGARGETGYAACMNEHAGIAYCRDTGGCCRIKNRVMDAVSGAWGFCRSDEFSDRGN
jgi:hypothetical protein